MKTNCPACGVELVVIVRDAAGPANARWSDASQEEKIEQARKMNAGKRIGVRVPDSITKQVEQAIASKTPAAQSVAQRIRPSDVCEHGVEYQHCRMLTCKAALG